MKTPKKYTNKQVMETLAKENGQTFSLLMQLAQEVHELGNMTQTMLAVIKGMPGYEDAAKKLQEAQDVSESTPATSSSTKTEDLILET